MPRSVDSITPFHVVSSCVSTFNIPHHLMGRSVHNPASDTTSTGRRLQKPRLGVRIPYRNLTSQIVTQEEIAKELLERSMKKNPGPQSSIPVAGTVKTELSRDSVLAMRLSRRLANRLSSPQKDLEGELNRNPEDMWDKVQAEASCENLHKINIQGLMSVSKQRSNEMHGVPSGDVSQATSPSTSLYSPRLNCHSSKLDRNAEREMALKQLSELPMIKGGSRELTGESVLSNLSKRPLTDSDDVLKLSINPRSSSDISSFEKRNLAQYPEGNVSSCVLQPFVQLHMCKLEDFTSSPKSQDSVVLNHIESNLVSQPVKIKEEENPVENIPQCEKTAIDKSFPKELKLRIRKTLRSRLPNGHCRTKIMKRRSARLSFAQPKIEGISSRLVSRDKLNSSNKRKRVFTGRKKNNNFPCTKTRAGPAVLKSASNAPLERELASSQRNLSGSDLCSTSLLHVYYPQSSLDSRNDQSSALKAVTVSEVIFPSSEMKENKVSDDDQEILKNNVQELSKSVSVKGSKEENQESMNCNSKELKKPSKHLRELDSLFIDEGAVNMLLEASPHTEEIVKPKYTKLSNKKELRKIARQSIHFKANLVRKHVLLGSTFSSRPKRRVKEKGKEDVEMIDLTNSPHKKTPSVSIEKSPKISTPVAPKSQCVIRQHSSSTSISDCVDGSARVVNDERSISSCFESNDSVQQNSMSKLEVADVKVPFVDIERLDVAHIKSSLNSNKQNSFSRFSSTRKVVTLPRMSNAVRMKLNSEMSKNFQRELDLRSAKNISPKTVKTKKNQVNSEIPLKTTSVGDQDKPRPIVNSDKIVYKCQKISKIGCKISESMKPQNILNGKELTVCVKKLQDYSEAPVTCVLDSSEKTGRLDSGHVIPEALSAVSVVPEEASSRISIGTVETIPKLKKCRDPNIMSFKNLTDVQHQINVPRSPVASSYNSIMKSLKNPNQKQHKKKTASKLEKQMEAKESLRQRFSGRQNAGSYNYKELCLRRYENFVQVILAPSSTSMKNSLNVQVLHEFRDALQQLNRDRFCRVVLVTSTGSTFCQGLDLHSLIHMNIEHRKKAAEELSQALKDFLKVLAMFKKPIVAGVHGATFGLGVTMLPFFDVVYASDKATFHAPYARFGQVPEGAAVLTLPLLLGNAVTSELLFGCKRLTACEALDYGLVTRVLWPDKFQEELIPNVKAMANQSSQSMESMKALLRLNLRVKLEATLDSESSLLVQHWCTPECQRNFRKFLETSDDVFFQRQKKDAS